VKRTGHCISLERKATKDWPKESPDSGDTNILRSPRMASGAGSIPAPLAQSRDTRKARRVSLSRRPLRVYHSVILADSLCTPRLNAARSHS
jgi:hypothetical protein